MEKEILLYQYDDLLSDILGDLFGLLIMVSVVSIVSFLLWKKVNLGFVSVVFMILVLLFVSVNIVAMYEAKYNKLHYVTGEVSKLVKSKTLSVYINNQKVSISSQTFLNYGFKDINHHFQEGKKYRVVYKEIRYHNYIYALYELGNGTN